MGTEDMGTEDMRPSSEGETSTHILRETSTKLLYWVHQVTYNV